MCPEFLREGVSVKDFFAPPFVVVGTADEKARATVAELFSFLDLETRHVAVATAESLKYACNAFHATKVSFANELARVFRGCGVDSREVMEIFCEDTKLNIALDVPATRLRLRRELPAEGPALPAVPGPRERRRRAAARRDRAHQRAGGPRRRRAGDRHRSTQGRPARAELQGRHRRPPGEPERRAGGAADRQGLRGPHLRPDHQPRPARRAPTSATSRPGSRTSTGCSPGAPRRRSSGAEVVLVSATGPVVTAALREAAPPHVIDLSGRLGAEVEQMAGYSGVGW